MDTLPKSEYYRILHRDTEFSFFVQRMLAGGHLENRRRGGAHGK